MLSLQKQIINIPQLSIALIFFLLIFYEEVY